MSLPSGLCSHPVAVRDYLSEYGCATQKWAKTDKPVELVINSNVKSEGPIIPKTVRRVLAKSLNIPYVVALITISGNSSVSISKWLQLTGTAVTGDTGWCLEEVKNRVHLGMHGGPLWLPQDCYLLNFCKL